MPMAQVALSALLSIVFFLALARVNVHNDVGRSSAVWLLYVVTVGGILQAKATDSLKRVLLLASLPTLTFFLTASFLTWFAQFAFTTMNFGASVAGGSAAPLEIDVPHQILIYLTISPPTLIGIALGCYARTALLNIYAKSQRLTVEELDSFSKKISVGLSILGTVGA